MHRIIVALALVLCSACVAAAQPTVSEPKRWSAEEARAELAELYERLSAAHYDLFAFRTRKEYDARYAATREAIRPDMSSLDLVRLFQPFVAFGGVGHARIEFPIQEYIVAAGRGDKILPIDVRFLKDQAFVAHNYTGDARLKPGTRIVSIDGRPITALRAEVARYVSAETRYLQDAQLEEFFPRWLWLHQGSFERVSLELEAPQGGKSSLVVPAMPIGEVETAKSQWATRFHGRELRLLEGQLAYLRPGPFYNTEAGDSMDTGAFVRFVDESFRKILAAGTRDLVIDLRGNPGGDNSFSDALIAWFADRPFRFSSDFRLKVSAETLEAYKPKPDAPADSNGIVARMHRAMARRTPGETLAFELPFARPRAGERYRGRVFLLVDRHSYSNSASMAALVQDYRFGKIIGEETADLPTSYASSMQFTLSRTRIAVTYPKSYFVRPSGDRRLRGVVPDHVIETPPPGTGRADDLVLERTLRIVRQK